MHWRQGPLLPPGILLQETSASTCRACACVAEAGQSESHCCTFWSRAADPEELPSHNLSLQHVEHFWLTKKGMFCVGAGSIPGKAGFLQISFAAAELWAHRTLYLMLSLLSSEVFCLSPEQCHCAVTSMLLCLSGPAFS